MDPTQPPLPDSAVLPHASTLDPVSTLTALFWGGLALFAAARQPAILVLLRRLGFGSLPLPLPPTPPTLPGPAEAAGNAPTPAARADSIEVRLARLEERDAATAAALAERCAVLQARVEALEEGQEKLHDRDQARALALNTAVEQLRQALEALAELRAARRR